MQVCGMLEAVFFPYTNALLGQRARIHNNSLQVKIQSKGGSDSLAANPFWQPFAAHMFSTLKAPPFQGQRK